MGGTLRAEHEHVNGCSEPSESLDRVVGKFCVWLDVTQRRDPQPRLLDVVIDLPLDIPGIVRVDRRGDRLECRQGGAALGRDPSREGNCLFAFREPS